MFNSNFSRRQFLKSAGVAVSLPTLSSLSNVSFASNGDATHTVVNVFLRGAMDSLSAIIPYTEQVKLDSLRPTIVIPLVGQIDIGDDQFALNKNLAPLKELYDSNDLAFVVATGLNKESSSRSHFTAQRRMESGVDIGDLTRGGWLGRYLSASDNSDHVFRGIGMGRVPKSLHGYDQALGLPKLSSWKLNKPRNVEEGAIPTAISELYQAIEHPLLVNQTMFTLDALEVAESDFESTTKPADYGNSKISDGLHEIADLINSNVGLETATVDMGGWDFHSNMGDWESGRQGQNFKHLGEALATFYNEIALHKENVTVVVMSEFGRRVKQNSSGGADHGKGGAMMVLGGNINGGQIYGDWPGLDELDQGDLKITTDYRQVLAELIAVRLGRPDLISTTFPDYDDILSNYLGIFG